MRDEPGFFEFLLESSQDGVWYWNLDAPAETWTQPEYWTAFGERRAEYEHVADRWSEVVDAEDAERLRRAAARHFEDASVPLDEVVRYRGKDGDTRWIRVRGRAVRDGCGRAIRLVGSHTDVTEQYRAREALEARNAELEAVNRELTTLAHAVSHDVRSPLRTLTSLLRLVQEDVLGNVSDDVDHTLRVALQSAERIHGVVDGIYQSAMLSASRPECEPVEVGMLVQDVVEGLGCCIEGVTLELGTLPLLHSSPALLRQVVHNLLDNALKFRRDGVRHVVAIDAEPAAEGGWVLVVRDNGVGIEPENMHRVFKPFVRLHSTAKYQGTGIGLALVRRAVERLGGRIEVASTPGEGTTMRVWHP